MQTAIRFTALTGLLASQNAAGFAPSTNLHSPSRVLMGLGRSETTLQATDFKQRVGSEVQSVFSGVQSLLPFAPNTTESITDSYGLEEARNSLELSLLASRSPQADLILDSTEKEIIRDDEGWSYSKFAKTYLNANNLAIASVKTACADLVAQVAVAHTPITEVDWARTALFFAFGFFYMGGFQYWYQVNVFKRFFDVDKFTTKSWAEKIRDKDGLSSLAAQTALDMAVSTLVYLPTFYVFQSSVFSGSSDPSIWISQASEKLGNNFAQDELDLIGIWGPADLICFSVPLYLRLPARHAVSFVYIAYFSFLRAG